MRSAILFFSLSLFLSIALNGQTQNGHIGNKVIIILLDKSEINGELVSEDERDIIVIRQGGFPAIDIVLKF